MVNEMAEWKVVTASQDERRYDASCSSSAAYKRNETHAGQLWFYLFFLMTPGHTLPVLTAREHGRHFRTPVNTARHG